MGQTPSHVKGGENMAVKKTVKKKVAVKKAAPKKAAPAKKSAVKAKARQRGAMSKGDQLSCDVCGMVLTVDESCGCTDVCDVICCGEQMRLI